MKIVQGRSCCWSNIGAECNDSEQQRDDYVVHCAVIPTERPLRRSAGQGEGVKMTHAFSSFFLSRLSAERSGGPDAGIEGTITSDDDLTTARRLYRLAYAHNPDRVIMLYDRARIPARSDRPDNMPR